MKSDLTTVVVLPAPGLVANLRRGSLVAKGLGRDPAGDYQGATGIGILPMRLKTVTRCEHHGLTLGYAHGRYGILLNA